jgi:hypothetical protein
MGKDFSRSGHNLGLHRSFGSSFDDPRNERRQLPAKGRRRKSPWRRSPRDARDNQKLLLIVAPRQSNPRQENIACVTVAPRQSSPRRDRRIGLPVRRNASIQIVALHTGHIKIIAKGRCADGRYYLKLRIRSERKYRTEILSLDALDSDPVKTPSTLRANLFTSQARREFLQRVQGSIELPVTFRVTARPGWCGGSFVLPSGRVVGNSNIGICLAADKNNVGAKFRRRGDFEAWRRIPELAQGNSRLMLALALSFVGPLGDLLKVEQVMIQLVGEPESGKSGIAVAAGSVWGGRRKAGRVDFSESWNCTDNELEALERSPSRLNRGDFPNRPHSDS